MSPFPPRQAKDKRSAAPGTQGVAQRHSTAEAGELASEDPVEGRALPTGGPRGGQQTEHSVAPVAVHVTLRDSLRGARSASAEVSRPRCQPVRGRTGCANRARPDLWEGWGETPIPTRPLRVPAAPFL